jgi:outer membrane protein
MKTLKVLTILFFMVTCVTLTGLAAKPLSGGIGYVDLSRLFDEYYKTKEYDEVLESKHNEFTEKVKEKVEEIKEAEGKMAIMNESKKAEMEGQIQDMRTELEEFDKQEKMNLTKERNEKIREILLEIEKVISEYAEQENYSIILNDRVLIYGAETLNLTEDVLKILNDKE